MDGTLIGVEMQEIAATGMQKRWREYSARRMSSDDEESVEESPIEEQRALQQETTWNQYDMHEEDTPVHKDKFLREVKAMDACTLFETWAMAGQERGHLLEDPMPVESSRAMIEAGPREEPLGLVAQAKNQDGYLHSLPDVGVLCDDTTPSPALEDRVNALDEVYYDGQETFMQKSWRGYQQRKRDRGQAKTCYNQQGGTYNESWYEQTDVGSLGEMLTEGGIHFPGICGNLDLNMKPFRIGRGMEVLVLNRCIESIKHIAGFKKL